MTVKAYDESSKFVGISSDLLPTGADEGATFYYVDTGEQYIFHDGMWEQDLRNPPPLDVFF